MHLASVVLAPIGYGAHMFATTTFTATDPDEYAAALRGANVELVSIDQGNFEASATWVGLDRFRIEHGVANRGVLARITPPLDRVAFTFLNPTSSAIIRNGTAVSPHEITVSALNQCTSLRSRESCDWATMSLSVDEFTNSYRALLGQDPEYPKAIRFLRPPQHLMTRLQAIHEAIVAVSKAAPKVIANSDVTRGFEHALLEALIASVATGSYQQRAQNPYHSHILSRFEELLSENPDRAMYLTEVCSAIGVAGRTLSYICGDRLGISPRRYLHLRRMHLARRALLSGTCETTKVTNVAMQFGFWELGRFAVAYRRLFGESPSATLRAPAERHLHQDTQHESIAAKLA